MDPKHEHTVDENGTEWCPATAEHEKPETIAVTISEEDARRLFQAMANEQGRIYSLGVDAQCIDHVVTLAERSRQWSLRFTEPIEGTDQAITAPAANASWDEALGTALEAAGAWDVFAMLSTGQRAIASEQLAQWAEGDSMGGPSLPSNPEADGLRSQLADLRLELERAELQQ